MRWPRSVDRSRAGRRGGSSPGPSIDLTAHAYLEKEFFLEGTATRYRPRPGTELGIDGRWDVEAVETSNFKTRFAVYRPVDPAVVQRNRARLLEQRLGRVRRLQHGQPRDPESGFAYAAVTAQRAGVHGMGDHPMGLVQWDPERYGSLSIPSDDDHDIFTQAARLVGADRPRSPIDPLEGLDVRHVVAIGGSQSAGRLATYINAVQPLERVFDVSCRSSTSARARPSRWATTCSTRPSRASAGACRGCHAGCAATSTPRS